MFPHQKYEDRLVAFIDVLGFSNMVSATASDEKRLQQLLLGVMEMVDNDILVRGGIARGQLIHDRTMVVGPAMVRAYQLESKEAKYPRIIIEKDLKEQIEADIEDYVINQLGLPEIPEQDKLFKTDAEDGWCYLDYVNPPSDYFGFLDPEDHLKALEKMVQKGLQSDKEEVRNKYPWLQKKIDEARLLIKI